MGKKVDNQNDNELNVDDGVDEKELSKVRAGKYSDPSSRNSKTSLEELYDRYDNSNEDWKDEEEARKKEEDELKAKEEAEKLAKEEELKKLEKDLEVDDVLGDDAFEKKVKIKVNGEEKVVALKDVVRTAQINEAADRRMQEASLKEKELNERMLKLLELEKEISKKLSEGSETAKPADNNKDEEKRLSSKKDALAKFLNLQYEGENEKAVEELLKAIEESAEEKAERRVQEALKSTKKEPAIDTVALTEKIKLELQWEDAISKFAGKNEKVMKDPVLSKVFMSEVNRLSGESSTYYEAVEKAENSIKNWMKSLGVEEKATGEIKVELSKEKQQAADEVKKNQIKPSAGASKGNTQEEELTEEEEYKQAILEMRKARYRNNNF